MTLESPDPGAPVEILGAENEGRDTEGRAICAFGAGGGGAGGGGAGAAFLAAAAAFFSASAAALACALA